MKLKRLTIRNFRCYERVEVQIDTLHALVGANNAGKSTILRALDFFFNPSTRRIDEESFYQKDVSRRIEVEALFIGLTETEADELRPYLRPDGTFQVMRTATYGTAPGDSGGATGEEESDAAKVSIQAHYNSSQPQLDWLNAAKITASAIAGWWTNKATLVHGAISFGATLGSAKPSVAEWKAAAEEFVKQHLTAADMEDTWVENPRGYAGVLKATLPHFELVPAVRDASDESKVTKTSPFGRLIYAIVATLDDGLRVDLTETLRKATERLNRVGGDRRAQQVTEIESTIKGFLADVMPVDLELEFQAPTTELLLTTPKIHIDDGFKGSIEGKGHGLQRALIFAILRSYAKFVTERPSKPKRTIILAVEEPELYMHPTAQRTVRRVLRKIADGGDQVLYSTHSPLLVEVEYFDEIIRVEASSQGNGASPSVYQLPATALLDDLVGRSPKLSGKVTVESVRERYRHAYTASRNEGFFARRVILVEGQTETYSIPIYAAAIGQELDALGVAVVECGGKDQMDRLYRVFNGLGLVCYPIFDYDRASSDPGNRRTTRELLQLIGGDSIPEPERAFIGDRFSMFAATWETDLRAEIPDYDDLVKEARESLGLSNEGGKPLIARYVARQLAEREPPVVPGTLKAIIEKALAATNPGSCLARDGGVTSEPYSDHTEAPDGL